MPFDATRTEPLTRGRAPEGLRELLTLAWPVVLARVGIMTMGLTDAVVVGRHSAEQLGRHALGWAPTSIVLTTGVGLLLGVQVMTARRVGEGRPEAAGGVLRRGIVYAFWVGVASMLVLSLGGPPFLHALGIERGLADGASRVLHVFAWSLPAYLVATVCIYFLEALERPLPGMVFMWVANGVNLVANLWLVPGHSGLPVAGAEASAWCTFIARAALALGLLAFIARMPEARALGVFRKPVDGREAAREQRRIGYASGASMFIEVGAFAAMTLIAGRIGGLQAAAWSVVLNVAAIIFMGPLGLSSATAVLVGRAWGARNRAGVVRAGGLGFAVAAAFSVVVVAVIWPGAALVGRAYSSDPGLLALAVPALVLSCLFFTTDGLQVVAAQALRARGDVWLPTGLHLASYGLVMLPLGWIFAERFGLGVDGLVWAVIVASAVSAVFLLGRWTWLARRAA